MDKLFQRKRIKLCKCGNEALKNRRICYNCFLKREKDKRVEKLIKFKERKKVKKEKDHNSYSYLHKKAWKLFSIIIRKEGADENGINKCHTCGTELNWKELQAGHFHHSKLDFDKRNVHPQCVRCNKFNHGNLAAYGTKLAKELGVKGMQKLDRDAHTKSYTWLELKSLIVEFEKLVNK